MLVESRGLFVLKGRDLGWGFGAACVMLVLDVR